MTDDLEKKLTRFDPESKRLRAEAFELRMDRLAESKKNAQNEEDMKRYKQLESASISTIKKYRNSYSF